MIILSGRLGLSGTSLSTDAGPTNLTDVAETDAGPTDAGSADDGLTDADLANVVPIDVSPTDVGLTHTDITEAAQTGLDPSSTNTGSTGVIPLNTGTLMAVEARIDARLKLRWREMAIVDHGVSDQATRRVQLLSVRGPRQDKS
jgi:hypothetical protein